jgi:hypothetical protein
MHDVVAVAVVLLSFHVNQVLDLRLGLGLSIQLFPEAIGVA